MADQKAAFDTAWWTQTIVVLLAVALAAGGAMYQINANSRVAEKNAIAIDVLETNCAMTVNRVSVLEVGTVNQSQWMKEMVSSIKELVSEIKTLNTRVVTTEINVKSLSDKWDKYERRIHSDASKVTQ